MKLQELHEAVIPKSVPPDVAKKIAHWDDERSSGNGIMVTTVQGWAFDPDDSSNLASHVQSFSNVRSAVSAVKQAAECPCDRCHPK